MEFFGGEEKRKTRIDKRMIKLEFFKIAYFDIYYKISTLHGHFPWPTFGFTPNKGSKGFVNSFFQTQNWTIKLDHGKRPSSMVLRRTLKP